MTQDFRAPGEMVTPQETIAGQIDDFLSQVTSVFGETVETASDAFNAAMLARQELGKGGSVHYGRIQYAVPLIGWYRVAVSDGDGVVPCCALQVGTSPSIFGAHGRASYQAHDEVLVQLFNYPTGLWGVILGALPTVVDDANVVFRDWCVQGSNVGVLRDGYYSSYITNLGDEGGTIDFGNLGNVDQTSFDWGVGTATGVSLHVDPFMGHFRVDETCGIELHYMDQFMVVAAYNGDMLTAASSAEWRNDEGENSYYLGESPYPWEMLGQFATGDQSVQVYADEDVHFELPVGHYEPVQEDQTAFHRYEEYGGYLGQGHQRSVSIPPENVSSASVYRLSDEDNLPICVFREHVGMDGGYSLATAKSYSVAKKSIVSTVKRKRLQESQEEDADSAANANYRFAGVHGNGENQVPHLVGDVDLQGDTSGLLTTAAILDLHAHTFNWKALSAFHYHTGDFVSQEESESTFATGQAALNFDSLASDMWFPQPTATPRKVDHRYEEVNYYQLLSHFSLTDDGGVVLQGGHGEEIRFVQGAIEISAPGGIHLRSGKSVAVLAGDDAIIRARNSVDVTATEHDVRLKAKVNMQLLSGNGGEGGMLLENKATSTVHNYPPEGGEAIRGSGIVLKAANSQVAALAGEIYLRTGNKHVASGPIVLDASQGQGVGDIRMVANNVRRYITGSSVDTFRNGANIRGVSMANGTTHTVSSDFGVDGTLRVKGSGLFESGVQAVGHFASRRGGPVSIIPNVDVLLRNIYSGTADVVEAQQSLAAQDLADNVYTKYYSSLRIGAEESGKLISASLREAGEYNTENFKFAACHHQVLMEAQNAGIAWEEDSVLYQDERAQQPWPGKAKWTDEATLLTLPPDKYNMYDVEAGIARDRGEDYEQAKLGPFVEKKPSEGYLVIDC